MIVIPLEDQARKVVTLSVWRWLPGMRWTIPDGEHHWWRVTSLEEEGGSRPFVVPEGFTASGSHRVRPLDLVQAGAIPDLEDEATLGAIAFGLLPANWSLAMEPGHGWGVTWGGVMGREARRG
jgi:hypothetical protein